MMFVTQEGEGFSGVWAGEYKKYGEKKGEQKLQSYTLNWIINLANVVHMLVVVTSDFSDGCLIWSIDLILCWHFWNMHFQVY